MDINDIQTETEDLTLSEEHLYYESKTNMPGFPGLDFPGLTGGRVPSLDLANQNHTYDIDAMLQRRPAYPYSTRKLNHLGNDLIRTLFIEDLSIYRLDLFHRGGIPYDEIMSKLKSLNESIKSKDALADGLTWWCRTVEWGRDAGYHFHYFLAYRYRCTHKPYSRAKLISDEWCRITGDAGYTYLSHFYQGSDREPVYILPRQLALYQQWHNPIWQSVLTVLAYFSKDDAHFTLTHPRARRCHSHSGPFYHHRYTEHTSSLFQTRQLLQRSRRYVKDLSLILWRDLHAALGHHTLAHPLYYTLSHHADYHRYDSDCGQRPHPYLYAILWIKSPTHQDHHSRLKLYYYPVPTAKELHTEASWDHLKHDLFLHYTYDGFVFDCHFPQYQPPR